jgi:opacity protein-like surface antigen
MRKLVTALAVTGALVAGVEEASAQVQIGAQVNIATDTDLGIGARVLFGLDQLVVGMEGIASFDYFFPDGFDFWELNGNVVVPVPITESFEPYLGGGLNLAFISSELDVPGDDDSDTEIGLNLVGGMKFATTNFRPFVEVRGTIAGAEQLVFTGGILLGGPR